MVKDFRIRLHASRCYHPGSVVSGLLVVELDKPKRYRSILVSLDGKASVKWRAGISGDHTSLKEYIDSDITVWTKEASLTQNMLPEGKHSFPFEFTLPPNIPSSFEGIYGWVRYTIRGKIVSLAGSSHYNISTVILVRECMNLKALSIHRPTQFRAEQYKVGCGCFGKGAINFSVEMAHTGFSVGESIPVCVHIENTSWQAVRLQAVLRRTEKYTGRTSSNITDHRIVKVSIGKSITSERIQPGESMVWTGEEVSIPANIPLTIRSCQRCINVEYHFEIKLIVTRFSSAVVKVPVVIGDRVAHRRAAALPDPHLQRLSPLDRLAAARNLPVNTNQQRSQTAAQGTQLRDLGLRPTHYHLSTDTMSGEDTSVSSAIAIQLMLERDIATKPDSSDLPPPPYDDVVMW